MAVASRHGETWNPSRAAVAERRLTFPMLHDPGGKVAAEWCTQQTPRAFLMDAQRTLLYRGAIDNFKYPEDPEYRRLSRTCHRSIPERGTDSANGNCQLRLCHPVRLLHPAEGIVNLPLGQFFKVPAALLETGLITVHAALGTAQRGIERGIDKVTGQKDPPPKGALLSTGLPTSIWRFPISPTAWLASPVTHRRTPPKCRASPPRSPTPRSVPSLSST